MGKLSDSTWTYLLNKIYKLSNWIEQRVLADSSRTRQLKRRSTSIFVNLPSVCFLYCDRHKCQKPLFQITWGPSRACVNLVRPLFHVMYINTRTWDYRCNQSCSIQNNVSVIFSKFINKFVQKCQCYYSLHTPRQNVWSFLVCMV